jgi:hypothetical protein
MNSIVHLISESMHNSNYAIWKRNSDEKTVYTQFTKAFFTLNPNASDPWMKFYKYF